MRNSNSNDINSSQTRRINNTNTMSKTITKTITNSQIRPTNNTNSISKSISHNQIMRSKNSNTTNSSSTGSISNSEIRRSNSIYLSPYHDQLANSDPLNPHMMAVSAWISSGHSRLKTTPYGSRGGAALP